jgi:hypothetical protein
VPASGKGESAKTVFRADYGAGHFGADYDSGHDLAHCRALGLAQRIERGTRRPDRGHGDQRLFLDQGVVVGARIERGGDHRLPGQRVARAGRPHRRAR